MRKSNLQILYSAYWLQLQHNNLAFQEIAFFRPKKYVMRCASWYHLYNLKNIKNAHGGVLLLVTLQASAFTKSMTPAWAFFTFYKLQKWYQIAQHITHFPFLTQISFFNLGYLITVSGNYAHSFSIEPSMHFLLLLLLYVVQTTKTILIIFLSNKKQNKTSFKTAHPILSCKFFLKLFLSSSSKRSSENHK